MRFWKLMAYLWSSGGSSDNRSRESRRAPTMDRLNGTDRLDDRSVHSTLWPEPSGSGRLRVAEVAQVSSAHRLHQGVRSQSQFIRLSVVVVDYLLEHEWISLLGGHRRHPSGEGRARRGTRDEAQRVPKDAGADPIDESNRTACVGESAWSIVAAIEQGPPPSSTTTTKE